MKRHNLQSDVIARLESQSQNAIDRIKMDGRRKIATLWKRAQLVMKFNIAHQYQSDFGKGNWNFSMARRKGTLARINQENTETLNTFHALSLQEAARSFRQIYKQGVLRHAWILDQVTPPKVTIKLPPSRLFSESAIKTYVGPDADAAWKLRWNSWLDSYNVALASNIKLGAINESSANDAANEVLQTRAGTPAYQVGDALDRVYMYQAVQSLVDATMDLQGANEGLEAVEIWQTRYNARVCDICDSQKGLTMDEADEDIPAHPNCECYWRLVPKSWADMLSSGDFEDQEIAEQMDAENLVPGAMVIRNADGELVGKTVVSFDRWAGGMAKAISAR